MSEAPSLPISPSMRLTHRLLIYVLWWFVVALVVVPFADPITNSFGGALNRWGLAVWSGHVLILVAVLTLSVPSLVVAFQLALLAALLQGYFYMASMAVWSRQSLGNRWDDQLQFAVVLGLTSALSAVGWLLVRMVGKTALSPEAAEGTGRSGQLALRELLYVMASLSAFLAIVSLFSFPGVIPVEQILAATVVYAGQIGPLTLIPFWLAAYDRLQTQRWKWVAPLMLLYAGLYLGSVNLSSIWMPWASVANSWSSLAGAFLAIVFGVAGAIVLNVPALHSLEFTWRQGGQASRAASTPAL